MKVLVIAAAIVALTGQAARDVVQSTTLQRMDDYLRAYEPRLSELVADETFHQELAPLTSLSLRPAVTRRLESEVAFARLPGDTSWIGFRRVLRVDGKPVRSSQESLAALLSLDNRDRLAQAQLLVIQSSEHNLGMPRTINLPNLPLELLLPHYRTRFGVALEGSSRVGGRQTLELMFKELAAPSIVTYGERRDLLCTMRVWIDTASGAVLRAQVRMTAGGITTDPQIDVAFEEHRALAMLVPTRMEERFPVSRSSVGKGRATYSNFRRFQTSGRIVPQ